MSVEYLDCFNIFPFPIALHNVLKMPFSFTFQKFGPVAPDIFLMTSYKSKQFQNLLLMVFQFLECDTEPIIHLSVH